MIFFHKYFFEMYLCVCVCVYIYIYIYIYIITTHVWIVSGKFFKYENVLMFSVSQMHQTVLAKLELPHFIETAFVHS